MLINERGRFKPIFVEFIFRHAKRVRKTFRLSQPVEMN